MIAAEADFGGSNISLTARNLVAQLTRFYGSLSSFFIPFNAFKLEKLA